MFALGLILSAEQQKHHLDEPNFVQAANIINAAAADLNAFSVTCRKNKNRLLRIVQVRQARAPAKERYKHIVCWQSSKVQKEERRKRGCC
jgi:hypothetical protein